MMGEARASHGRVMGESWTGDVVGLEGHDGGVMGYG